MPGLDFGAGPAGARLHGQHPRQEFQEGGFASAIRPHQHDALSAFGLKMNASINHIWPIGMMKVFERDDFQSTPLRLWEREFDLALVSGGRFDLFHPFDLLELALGLRSFRIFGAKAIHELHEVGNFPLLIFAGGEELNLTRLALDEIVFVIAAIADEMALADFQNAIHNLVHILAVMPDEQN